MNFSDALAALREGKPVRRTAYSEIKLIRYVDPSVERDSDGPDFVWIVLFKDKAYSKMSPFETEEAAAAAFEAIKTKHKDHWKTYNGFRSRYDAASPQEQQQWPAEKKIPAPQLPRDAYDSEDFSIVKRPAPRKYRINTPFLVRVLKDGTVEPHYVSNSDLTASDWKVA